MLAGVPVIASADGGPAEILTDGVNGLLYPAGDIKALADALQRLRRDDLLRSGLSDEGRTRAASFSPQVAASGVMALYGRVLECGDRRRKR